MRSTPTRIFLVMCAGFLMYSVIIYTMPLREGRTNGKSVEKATQGKLVWQKYNCQACHQLFGLGGYLGPDLTNVTSRDKQSEAIIRSVVRSGTRQMPAFEMSEEELGMLLEFLRYTDSQGTADPRSFRSTILGTIESK